ncbi:MAG: SDR family oxidoreductase [Flavobacterium sp.]|uniref:SDR family oxidoreductase n=1 Tax=Flavobacterium sp. TaxID=239 RepID=UPI0025BE0F75|nr:SDR family oxidoreductase [Flavobacterium sp.]MCK6609294.1 SDR family oxidoreductase [Flavobacterium sp.]
MKVLLFGATGNLGQAMANELKQKGYETTCVVRDTSKLKGLESITDKFINADVTNPVSLINICSSFDIIISALGKSVSPNDNSKPSFKDIDYIANSNILNEAKKSTVKKFIYISAFHSEKYLHLEYFKVHHEFSQKLISSGINYTIIKPPAIFSAFKDMVEMAKKGQLINIGLGDKKTNPIYEGDLAGIIVESIKGSNQIIEAGGKVIYTRRQINEIIQKSTNPEKKIRYAPLSLFKLILSLMKLINKNLFDKYSFFIEVMQHDTIAPQLGKMTLEEYLTLKKQNTIQ